MGTSWAYLLPESPNIDSLGQLIRDHKLAFFWSNSEFEKPVLIMEETAPEIISEFTDKIKDLSITNIYVEGNVPLIRSDRPRRLSVVRPVTDRILSCAARHVADRKLVSNKSRLSPGATAHPLKDAKDSLHNPLTHTPSDPKGCDHCRTSKLQKRPARRKTYISNESIHMSSDADNTTPGSQRQPRKGPTTSRAPAFGDVKSVDILDPSREASFF